ncbi:four helix bundle protein [Tangfeifania diversioriginum]|uniref:Four helix bundle protein n=1 Tax=Tangfeifania diversioriginum TaxID=1168035 RepID=A0A1M6P8P4_9BACT|nr:four helix bundle protein [Tangfeifania diversioriginum]SHK04280.1 four helix bundle protein [Tangfeifania diversioriginum]
MEEKNVFVEGLKKRTKKFGVDVILFCDSLRKCRASAVVTYQLVKAATSVGANYRSACRGRSDAEFFSKLCIVVEEADESVFWLEVIEDSNLSNDPVELKRLLDEGTEILKITTKSKDTTYKRLHSKH